MNDHCQRLNKNDKFSKSDLKGCWILLEVAGFNEVVIGIWGVVGTQGKKSVDLFSWNRVAPNLHWSSTLMIPRTLTDESVWGIMTGFHFKATPLADPPLINQHFLLRWKQNNMTDWNFE